MARKNQETKQSDLFPTREERVAYSGGTQKKSNSSTQQGKKQEKKANRKRGKKKSNIRISPRQMGILILLVFVCFALLFGLRKNGAEVFVGKESIGILKDKRITSEELTKDLEAQLKEVVGTAVKINEKIKVQKIHIPKDKKKNICTKEYLLPKLQGKVTYKVEASVIFVDGSKVAALAKEEDAKEVLKIMKTKAVAEKQEEQQKKEADKPKEEKQKEQKEAQPNQETAKGENSQKEETNNSASQTEQAKKTKKSEGNVKVEFVEKVTIEKQFVASSELLSIEDTVKLLEGTTPVTETYTVQEGDTLGKIASSHNMAQKDLLEMNPGMTITTPVIIGKVLNVTVQKPLVSVKTIETQELIMVEKKTYEYRDNPDKPKSYQRVVQRGRDGQKKSTIQITRVNTMITEEKEISNEVIEKAVPEIIERGTA